MRGRRDSLATLKALFTRNYEEVADKAEVDTLKSEYVVLGSATKRTLTLQINPDDIKVFVHDEDGITLNETVPFKNIKSITVPSKNIVAVDWTHGPYQTQDVSRFHTREGEAKKIRDKFYHLLSPTKLS